MTQSAVLPNIVVVDDSYSDRRLMLEAFREARLHNPVHEIEDGEELMDYLLRRDKYSNTPCPPGPMLILLDINMPRKNGLVALAEIKSNPRLRMIPIIMLTTSRAEEDIIRSYSLGVNSFVTKPLDFASFLKVVKEIGSYWLELVSLPEGESKENAGMADRASASG